MWKVPLFELNFDNQESEAVQQVIESRWLTMGEQILSFESQFSSQIGSSVYATAVSSCTAALHIALLALDIKPGDEVIIPALTFVADINAVVMTGATPVPADSETLSDWNVSCRSIQERITSKTKAVIVVHFAGYPCDMESIAKLCHEHQIALIEDVAHGPGISYRGKQCGSFGQVGCFSFFTNKNLSIGEGGMFITGDPELHQKALYLRSHGMTALTLDRHKGRAISYDVMQPGLNYRMDEIRAAIGQVQLQKLSAANSRRGKLVSHYIQCLSHCDGVSIPFLDSIGQLDIQPAYHIFPVLLSPEYHRPKVIDSLKHEGIQTSIHYPSFRDFSAYNTYGFAPTPVADQISRQVLTLPLFPGMTFEQVELVANTLKSIIQNMEHHHATST